MKVALLLISVVRMPRSSRSWRKKRS